MYTLAVYEHTCMMRLDLPKRLYQCLIGLAGWEICDVNVIT